jgi:hypothetical protein
MLRLDLLQQSKKAFSSLKQSQREFFNLSMFNSAKNQIGLISASQEPKEN